MDVKFVDIQAIYKENQTQIDKVVGEVLASGAYILGDYVTKFEEQMSEYLGVQVVSCANGSDALLLALMAEGVGPGDEVITTPFTFFATASAITTVGAIPVFVDIDPDTFNIDVTKIEAACTAKTKAIIPVHIFGQCSDMDLIADIAKKKKLVVIEDACQAIGAKHNQNLAGTIGDYGCFSFYPTKNLGAFGDAGLVVAKDQDKLELLKSLRVHGSKVRYHHDVVGINSRLDAIQAAILSVLLPGLDEKNEKRLGVAQRYDSGLKEVVKTPVMANNCSHVYHQYAIIVAKEKRDGLGAFLSEQGIQNGVYYPIPLQLQKCFGFLGYEKGDLPVSEDVAERILSIPMHSFLSYEEIDYVTEKVASFVN